MQYSESSGWYVIDEIEKLDSPALVVFPERVKQNIRTARNMVSHVSRLRPHVKTNKSPQASQLLLEAGITKFKCATIAEAEMLGNIGAPDVLLAYQPLGPKLQRFIALVKKFPATNYSCLTDNLNAAREQSSEFSKNELEISVYVDVNVGMNRTGVIPAGAVTLCTALASMSGISFAGLHAYDGHIRNRDLNERTKECDEGFAAIQHLKEELLQRGIAVGTVIVGGSPTFPIHAKRSDVECSPGTFIYWDKGYVDLCPEQKFLPAAVLVTRVISLPSAARVCTDLGHKSVAAENEMARRISFLNAPGLAPVSQSEEHLVCEVTDGNSYKTGDILYGLPYHVCPTVALYERAYVVEDGKITGEWKNEARDRKINL